MKLLVFDVGGTAIKYCTMDESYIPMNVGSIPTPLTGLQDYLDVLTKIYEEFADEVDGVAMSVPGVVDPDTGYQKTGGSLNAFVHEVSLAQIISERLGGVRVALENDAKAAGYAEMVSGALKDCTNGVAVILGTGIGGCIMVNREIVRGANGFAGELSALILNDGYLEENRFGTVGYPLWAEKNSYKSLLTNLASRTGEKEEDLNGLIFFERANRGDSDALTVLKQFCKGMCMPISIMQVMIDAEVIAIGGGISAQPLLIQMINEAYDEFLKHDLAYQVQMKPKPVITNCKFHNSANQVGAYCNFVRVYGNT